MKIALICLLLGSFLTLCFSAPPKPSSVQPASYFCQFFNDGTYSCYSKTRDAKDGENASTGQRDSYWGRIGVGAAVRGPWKTEDGFFQLPSEVNARAPKKYVGTCVFDREFQCSPAPPLCPTPKENGPPVSCVDPVLFRGMWSGKIGGRLKASGRKDAKSVKIV